MLIQRIIIPISLARTRKLAKEIAVDPFGKKNHIFATISELTFQILFSSIIWLGICVKLQQDWNCKHFSLFLAVQIEVNFSSTIAVFQKLAF